MKSNLLTHSPHHWQTVIIRQSIAHTTHVLSMLAASKGVNGWRPSILERNPCLHIRYKSKTMA